MENVVRYVREREDANRARHGLEPVTDLEFVDRLLALKYFHAAEELLASHYAKVDRS